MKALFLTSLLLIMATPALAKSRPMLNIDEYTFSAGLSIGKYYYSNNGSPNLYPFALEGIFDYAPFDYLEFSLRAGTGVYEDKETINNFEQTAKIEYVASLYAKPQYKMENVTTYALLGYSDTKLTLNQGNSEEETRALKGFSYGVGMSFSDWQYTALSIEMRRVHEKDDTKLDAFNLNFNYFF